MNTQFIKILLTIGIAFSLFSCGENKIQFTVQGNVNDADTLMLFLERRGLSEIIVLDSIKLDKSGKFNFKQNAINYSEFYRLRLGNQSINFSIDTTETVTISASKPTFATEYNIEGSESATKIKQAVLSQFVLRNEITKLRKEHADQSISDQQFADSIGIAIDQYKEEARQIIIDDYKSTAAYFTLFQKVENMLIFDPNDKKDLSFFRAVATVWNTYRSESPRATQLNDFTLTAIANTKANENREAALNMLLEGNTTENKEYFAIELPNIKGEMVSTKSLKGKVIVLDFTVYQSEFSMIHNVRLNKAYDKYKSQIEIYQVSLDVDKHSWQNAAVNLPWITVRDDRSTNSPLIGTFNIENLPCTYILGKNGDIIKKLNLNDDLLSEVAKVL